MTICPDLVELPPGPGKQGCRGQARKATVSHSSISMFLKSLMPLVHVPVMLGMLFGMEHLCALPDEQFHRSGVSLLPNFTVPDPMSYPVLHLTQGLYTVSLCEIYMIQSNKYGSVRHETEASGEARGKPALDF
jgi:hypothetical protein